MTHVCAGIRLPLDQRGELAEPPAVQLRHHYLKHSEILSETNLAQWTDISHRSESRAFRQRRPPVLEARQFHGREAVPKVHRRAAELRYYRIRRTRKSIPSEHRNDLLKQFRPRQTAFRGDRSRSFPWLEYSEAGGVCRCGQEDDGDGGGRDGRPGRLVRQSPHVVVDVLPECGDVAVLSSNGRLQRERATSITSRSLTHFPIRRKRKGRTLARRTTSVSPAFGTSSKNAQCLEFCEGHCMSSNDLPVWGDCRQRNRKTGLHFPIGHCAGF